jgi:hypothetical protein
MAKQVKPEHFYLNEQHELSRTDREGGGSLPKLGEIDWSAKGNQLRGSLARTRRAIERSSDPLKGSRYFLLAQPELAIPKLSSNKTKHPTGGFEEEVDYAGKDARVLGKLGLDVLAVTDRGAVVHATPERLLRLEAMAPKLAELGKAEQSRWASLADFGTVPPTSARTAAGWLPFGTASTKRSLNCNPCCPGLKAPSC